MRLAVSSALPINFAAAELSPLWRMFLSPEFLGALTTFSSFSAEVMVLVHEGDVGRCIDAGSHAWWRRWC